MKVFGTFNQAKKMGEEGMNLGLQVSQKIVEAMNGRIGVKKLKSGLTWFAFSITLPNNKKIEQCLFVKAITEPEKQNINLPRPVQEISEYVEA